MAPTGHDYDVLWAFSNKKQADYDTKLDNADFTLSAAFKGPDVAEVKPDYQGDEDQFGKGHEWGTEQQLERWDAKLSRNFDATTLNMGWALAFGMGAVESAQQGETTAYKHTFTFSDPGTVENQNPVTSVVEDRDGVKRLIRGLAVNSVTVSGALNARLQLALELIGSGYAEASAIEMPAITSAEILRMRGVKFELGPSGALVDVSARIRSWNTAINNNLMADDGYAPGCGLYRSRCRYGKRAASLGFVLERQAAQEKDWLEANTLLQAVITCEGALVDDPYKHSLIVTFTKLKLKALPVSYESPFEIYTAEVLPIYNADDGGPVKIEVINDQVSYLT